MKNIHEVAKNTFIPTEEMVQVPVEMLEYIMKKGTATHIRIELKRMLDETPTIYGASNRLKRILSFEDKLREMRGFLQLCKLQEMMQDTPTVDEEKKIRPEDEVIYGLDTGTFGA